MFEYLQEVVMENDATYMENCLAVIDDCMFAYESAETRMDYDTITESFTGAVGNLLTRIAETFRKVVEKITSLFRRDKDEALNKKIRSNPELAKKKIKVGDQEKLNKLYDDCNKKLEKGEDPNKVLAFFRDHSKQIIAGTVGAVAISLGAFLIWKRKSNDKSGKDVDKKGKEVVNNLKKWMNDLARKVRKGSPADIKKNYPINEEKIKEGEIASAQTTLANMMGTAVSELNREHYAACAEAIKETRGRKGKAGLINNAVISAPMGRSISGGKNTSAYDTNRLAADITSGRIGINYNKESVDDFDDYLESSYDEFSADYDYDYDYDDYM